MAPGTPVCYDANGDFIRASAAQTDRWPSVGLVLELRQPHYEPNVIHLGFIDLLSWQAIIGTSLLTVGAPYYLSNTPGMLSPNSQESGALISQLIGVAVTPNRMQIELRDAIVLSNIAVQGTQRKALVLNNLGQVGELPAGSTLAGSSAPLFTGQNKGSNFWIGAAVARHSSGTGLILADATAMVRRSIGLATVGALTNFAEDVQLEGPFVLNDWTAVIGAVSLQPETDYFLSATPGMLTPISPSISGQISQPVGFSVTPTTLIINIEQAILL